MENEKVEVIYPWNPIEGRGAIILGVDGMLSELYELSGFKKWGELFGYDDFLIEIIIYKHEKDGTWLIDFWDESQISIVTCDNEREKIEVLRIFIEMAKNIIYIKQQTEKYRIN